MNSRGASIRRHTIAVAATAGFLVCGIGIMGAATDMSGAIISKGSLVVESDVKKVQHPSGGVAKQLVVREGDHVGKDDLLIRMDETVAQANLIASPRTCGNWKPGARGCKASATPSPKFRFRIR